jgi:cytochrome c553
VPIGPDRIHSGIMKKPAALAALACMVALASHSAAAADLAAGAAKAQVCAPCHGANGVSQTALTPSLAGQPDGFLQWQLVFFRNGVRKNPLMQPMAASLSDDDIRNLAAHFAALPPAPAAANGPQDPALYDAGKRLAAVHRCAACHKDDFSGTQAAARTGAQREDYLLSALRAFKSGARTGTGVAAMPDAVYPLSDEQLQALAHFMAHVPAATP